MTKVNLKYIHSFTDRHGKPRHYFRRPGFKQVALLGANPLARLNSWRRIRLR